MNGPYPKDFLWGASTASHQVEGGTHNQWSEWEMAKAEELAATADQSLNRMPAWGKFKAVAETPENYISGDGVDHFHRYQEDFDILSSLNMNAFRFGIEWSRVEPGPGQWDEAALAHYHRYIDEMVARGITPILNLWHWTMPVWFTDKGGFANKANLADWRRYVHKMADEYGGKVKYVLTLNESNVYTTFSYAMGEWPPQQSGKITAVKVYRNLYLAHRQAYSILKAVAPEIRVGVAQNLGDVLPKQTGNPLHRLSAAGQTYFWNWWFLDRIRKYQDFIGVNFYSTAYTRLFKEDNPKQPTNDLGWYMEPGGLGRVLNKTWRRYGKPLIVTENGVADADDTYRKWWLEETMKAMESSMAAGVQLLGYMHWSLLDNFEWKYGWWPKFGLVAVDRMHGMTRTVRPSARWFGDQIKKYRGLT